MKAAESLIQKSSLIFIVVLLPTLLLYNNCGSSGGSGGGGSAASVVKIPMVISSGGITVGLNTFDFKHLQASKPGLNTPDLIRSLLLPTAEALPSSYRVSPDKTKLRITGISFQPVEQNADTSTESAFNLAQLCEIDYDKSNPNQTFSCTVELQVGLHYKTIDFKVAPNVDVYINDSSNGIYTTAAGLTTSNPGASLDYFTASFNNNTSFHAEFPFPIDTTALNTSLTKIKTVDGCSNIIEVKMLLSKGTVLSDTTYTPGSPCGTAGTTQSTTNIGTQNLSVVVDMIHGIQVDRGANLTVNTTVPWWTIAGTIGTELSVKHFASTASGITSATYAFPPSTVGINEVKVAYANGVAVGAQMVPNGFNTTTFCHDDYDTPNNSPSNGYVGSDSTGAAWAVGPWSNGKITNYTSEYFMNTGTNTFYCNPISADPDPNPGQALDTFSANMPNTSGWRSQSMTRIDN